MTAYYNEIDEYAAQWLRNLIAADLIAPGVVDTRSILQVQPDDLKGFTQCHFFAGIGGWSLALRIAGVPDSFRCWTGSCPCQPFSAAGKQRGFADERHLWPHFARLIGECRPPIVLGEQVASATAWLGLVRGDLEALEYAVGAIPIQAASAGADHLRDRYWFVGHDTRVGRGEGRPEHEFRSGREPVAGDGGGVNLANTDGRGRGTDGQRGSLAEISGGIPLAGRATTERSARGVGQADADKPGSQGRLFHAERADQWPVGADGLADAVRAERRPDAKGRINDADRADAGRQEASGRPAIRSEEHEWVIGADGKARRVKPGIRLLANGVPDRVAKLRAFGNAIDPRPASEFIRAALAA